MSGARKAAIAVANRIGREGQRASYNNQLAEVVTIKPLRIRMFDTGHELDEGEFDIGQSLRAYDLKYGIKADDNLVMGKSSGNWVAVEVLATEAPDDVGMFGYEIAKGERVRVRRGKLGFIHGELDVQGTLIVEGRLVGVN